MNHYYNQQRPPGQRFLLDRDSKLSYEKLMNFNTIEIKNNPVNMEILEFMHLLMDECTHMINFDVPVDTSLIKILSAKDDAYVLRDGVSDFKSIWPGEAETSYYFRKPEPSF